MKAKINMWIKPFSIYAVVALILVMFVTSGCGNTIERLEEVGLPPRMEVVQNPQERGGYRPMTWPASQPREAKRTSNSLWQDGNRSFFRDGRARDIGDILTVLIDIQDKAELDNKTERTREGTEGLSMPSLFGLERRLTGILPRDADPANLLNLESDSEATGEGLIEREEQIQTQMAAVVTQVLPNGNMVIHGSQQIRVNYELRHLTVEGVVRPSSIKPDNSVELNQIAEARVSYGGKGQIMDVQQPRLGTQIVDILSPW